MARQSREVWTRRVAEWKASGLTAAKFSRKHRFVEGSLKWWSWKLGSERKTPVSPLTFVEMTAAVHDEAFEIVVGNVHVRVPVNFDEAALARVLGVLEQRR
jgi:hypothetical protein